MFTCLVTLFSNNLVSPLHFLLGSVIIILTILLLLTLGILCGAVGVSLQRLFFLLQCSACVYRPRMSIPGIAFVWMFHEVWCHNAWLNTLESLLIIDVSLLLGKHCQFQPEFLQAHFAPLCSQFAASHSSCSLQLMSHWMLGHLIW